MLVDAGFSGHINVESDHGPWPKALIPDALRNFSKAAVNPKLLLIPAREAPGTDLPLAKKFLFCRLFAENHYAYAPGKQLPWNAFAALLRPHNLANEATC